MAKEKQARKLESKNETSEYDKGNNRFLEKGKGVVSRLKKI